MNCRDFLSEFEERAALTETATLHLNDCAGCKKASGEQTRLWQMIETLPTVEAPNDFDFRLKARIANRKPQKYQPRFAPALRYALPSVAAVFVLALVAFYSLSSTNNTTTAPPVAHNSAPAQIKKESVPVNSSARETDAASASESAADGESIADFPIRMRQPKEANLFTGKKKFVAVKNEQTWSAARRKDAAKTDFGASRDSASTSARVIVPPKIVGADKTLRTAAPDAGNQNSATAEQILSRLDMETVVENGNRKVQSLKQNGIAARSGVKTGDVVEAIDGRELSAEPTGVKPIEGKTLTVRRGAAKIQITLRN